MGESKLQRGLGGLGGLGGRRMAKGKFFQKAKGVSFPGVGGLHDAAAALKRGAGSKVAKTGAKVHRGSGAASGAAVGHRSDEFLREKIEGRNNGRNDGRKGGSGGAAGRAGQKVEGARVSTGFKMNKLLGQHLLRNPGIVKKIIDAANINRSDVVLEIGPGTGNLTVQLCGLARKVRALEIDSRMVAEVKKRMLNAGFTNFEIVQGDALKSPFGEFQVCTANLPYQISSPFLFRLLSNKTRFRCAVLMFQKEFGERLVALPNDKNYCRLGVNAQLFCTITRVCHVDRKSFNPPPKVDSIVVKLVPKKTKTRIDYFQWDAMLRLIFSRKRKTLRAIFCQNKALRTLLHIYKALKCTTPNAVPNLAVAQDITSLTTTTTEPFSSTSPPVVEASHVMGLGGMELGEMELGGMEEAEGGIEGDGKNGKEGKWKADATEVAEFKALVAEALAENGFASRRAVTMSIPDFTILLAAFHSRGIYFPSDRSSGTKRPTDSQSQAAATAEALARNALSGTLKNNVIIDRRNASLTHSPAHTQTQIDENDMEIPLSLFSDFMQEGNDDDGDDGEDEE